MGDFHKAFEAIDEDNSGEITVDELRHYMVKNNYKETFVSKWLSLFDTDHCGKITYEHFCEVLGLTPKEKEVKEEVMVVEEQKQESSSAIELAANDNKVSQKSRECEEMIVIDQQTQESSAAIKLPSNDNKISQKSRECEEMIVIDQQTQESSAAMEIPPETSKSSTVKQVKSQKQKQKPTINAEESIKPTKQSSQSTSPIETNKSNKSKNPKPKQVPVKENKQPKQKSQPIQQTEKPKSTPTTNQNQNQTQSVLSSKKNNTKYARNQKRLSIPFSEQKKRIRDNLQPGTCAIIVAGKHKGKRVVIVERLESVGLLLISGPFRINGCPLRRIHPDHIIGTKTKIDLGDNFVIPERILEKQYFTRDKDIKRQLIREERKKNELVSSSKIKEIKNSSQTVSEERKVDQKKIDQQIIDRIRARGSDAKMMARYLKTPFSLSHSDYPHSMVF